ncbi:linear amide C-N hydrolase [Paraflavitalea sp. CAU 1676]|uniref:linear amide C-N hydrolase n=1 Tax=Paraflavitalea sp. CAU 1676 TaxID=3032598 RepID=UPI0023DA83CB|nr:linear amide C-N hydrolase [Paraflavitalea sp. CAU 1676]MDF2188491.1 linear amide C-N hydrolase [Paraflavitalea sp. CAU 1676]
MKKTVTFLLLIVLSVASFACSTFLLSKDGRHVFGRNYDWVSGNGMMMVNARGVLKTSFRQDEGKTISWTAAYGSVTFNQFGKEFPHGGMNEKGLVVELMWLNETVYPQADGRACLNELQWIQYQLDNYTTIEEVVASDHQIRIDRTGAAPLHYLVADARGNAATIEFIKGKMIVHRGSSLAYPVLTNTVYEDAVKQVDKNKPAGYDNSVERFATACSMIKQYQGGSNNTNSVDYAFTILDKVSQKGYTRWSIVYDITNLQVYCITDQQPQRKQVDFYKIDFTCNTSAPPALNLSSGRKGDVTQLFTPLSFEQNKAVIERSARECSTHIQVTQASIDKVAAYFREPHCK